MTSVSFSIVERSTLVYNVDTIYSRSVISAFLDKPSYISLRTINFCKAVLKTGLLTLLYNI